MLRALDVDVVHTRDNDWDGLDDVELFARLAGEGFVFVTGDRRQRARQREALTIREFGITGLWFCPFWDHLKFWQQAAWLTKHWPTIDGYVSGVSQGTLSEVQQNGRSKPFSLT